MKRLVLVISMLFLLTPAFSQVGEINLGWDDVTTLCDSSPATNIEYWVHWSLSPQDSLTSPPAGYENMVQATGTTYTLSSLVDCTTYYVAASSRNAAGWSGCGETGGYSNVVAAGARPRLDPPNITALERGMFHTLVITGYNFSSGFFQDPAGLFWSTPIIDSCNQITVGVDVPSITNLGPVDVTYNRGSDNVSIVNPSYITIIASTNAPAPPTFVRRTQPE